MLHRDSKGVFLAYLPLFCIVLLELQIVRFSGRSDRDVENDVTHDFYPANGKETTIVFYNRVPKTGSTTFVNLVYHLSGANKINVVHFNTSKNRLQLSIMDQYNMARNISDWAMSKSGFFHGHTAYLNFAKFGCRVAPAYINIIRRPLERLVSHYYFVRFGDDIGTQLSPSKKRNMITFDQCVQEGGVDCSVEKLWLQIPFFCGQLAECLIPGNQWALDQAKRNLLEKYVLVGLSEQMEDFMAVLEGIFPHMFTGLSKLYKEGFMSHMRNTIFKALPLQDTMEYFYNSSIWEMEDEFYQFAKEQFDFVKHRTRSANYDELGNLRSTQSEVAYDKIRGKSKVDTIF